MNNLLGLGYQIKDEQRSFWRNPPAAVFTFGFTLMFLVLFSAIFGNQKLGAFHGIKFIDYFVPSIITFGIISSCYTSIAMLLVNRTKNGAFKRLRLTPLPQSIYLGGILGSSVITGLLLTIITILFGTIFYHLNFPSNIGIFILSIAVGSVAFSLLGVLVATFVPNIESGPPVINGIILPLYFISGTFFVISPNSIISKIAGVFPVRPFILSTFYAYQSTKYVPSNFDKAGFLTLLIWIIATSVLVFYRFKHLGHRKP
jgi:ABC-2 type transport system permease protein